MSTEKEDTRGTVAEEASPDEGHPSPSAAKPEALDAPAGPEESVPDPVRLFNSWCKGCGICVAFCPTKTLGISAITGKCVILLPEACTRCGLCELRCPDFAITVILNERSHAGDKHA